MEVSPDELDSKVKLLTTNDGITVAGVLAIPSGSSGSTQKRRFWLSNIVIR